MSGDRPRRKGRRAGPRRWHRQWHRYLGAIFAVPLLWLVVSGLLLQHGERLGLTEKKVSSAWLLKRYNQIPQGIPKVTRAGRFLVAGWSGEIFVDDRLLEESGLLVGAVALPGELVIATENEIFVYDAQGLYLDRLGEESLPSVPLLRIGLAGSDQIHLETDAGQHVLGEGFFEFETAPSGAEVVWSDLREGREERSSLEKVLVEGSEFTWSRVITDLHSGSLLGKLGRFFVDLTGVAVLVVTVLGIRLLFRRK